MRDLIGNGDEGMRTGNMNGQEWVLRGVLQRAERDGVESGRQTRGLLRGRSVWQCGVGE